MNIWELYAKLGRHKLPSTATVLIRDKTGTLYDVEQVKEEAETVIIDVVLHDQQDINSS